MEGVSHDCCRIREYFNAVEWHQALGGSQGDVVPTVAAPGNILMPQNGTRCQGEARGIWFPQLLHPGACPIKLRSRCAAQIPADHLSQLTIHIGNASGPSLPVLAPYRAIAQFVIAIAAHCRVAQTYEKLTCNPMIFSHRLLAERIRTTVG